MIALDHETVRTVAAIGMTGPTAVFAATTIAHHNEPASRVWTVGFMTLVGATAASSVEGEDPGRALLGAITGALVFAVGSIWVGLRMIHQRSAPGLSLLFGLTVVAGTAVAIPNLDVARVTQMLAIAAFAALGFRELNSGPMRRYAEAILLRAILAVLLVAAVGAAVRTIVSAPPGSSPSDWRIIMFAAALNLMVMVALSGMREGDAVRQHPDDLLPVGVTAHDILFDRARELIARTAATAEQITMTTVHITDISSINTAYGQVARERSTAFVGDVIRDHVPAAATIGYVGDGSFVVLTTHAPDKLGADIAGRISTGLMETMPPEDVPLRLHCAVDTIDPASAQQIDQVIRTGLSQS